MGVNGTRTLVPIHESAIISASRLPLIFFNISEQLCFPSISLKTRYSIFFFRNLFHKQQIRGRDFNLRNRRIDSKSVSALKGTSERKLYVILLLDVRLREIIIDRGPGAEFPNNAAFVFPRRRGPRINSNFHLSPPSSDPTALPAIFNLYF